MSSHSSDATRSGRGSSRRHRDRRLRDVGKPLLILHALNALFSFVAVIIFGSIVPLWNANFFHAKGPVQGDWPDGLPIFPLLIVFGTSLQHLVRRFVHNRRNEAQSGDYLKCRVSNSAQTVRLTKIKLYLHLTVLILLLSFLVLAGVSGLYRFWRPSIITTSAELSAGIISSFSTLSLRRSLSDANPTSLTPPTISSSKSAHTSKEIVRSCTFANILTRRCNPTLYLIGDLQIAAISIGSLVWILNLMLLVFLSREYQHQKRKHQRSLRAKAKAKLDLMSEQDLDQAEKGAFYTSTGERHNMKKVHHSTDRGYTKPISDSNRSAADSVTRPKRAYSSTDSRKHPSGALAGSFPRPKQHYFNPHISPSRSKDADTEAIPPQQSSRIADGQQRYTQQTMYSLAIEEARKKMRPAETMRDWMATRQR